MTSTNGPKPLADTQFVGVLEHLESLDPGLEMTDRQMLVELVLGQREMRKLVKGFVASMEKNPMFATMGKMFGGK